MRFGEGVEWAAHCTVVLATLPDRSALPAARLAEYHGIPAPYLAKSLQALMHAGIVASAPGRRGGYRLARPPAEITLFDVVEAIEGPEPFFRCTEIRRRGPTAMPARAYSASCAITAAMGRAEAAWREELQAVTVAAIVSEVAATAPGQAREKTAVWLGAVLSGRS